MITELFYLYILNIHSSSLHTCPFFLDTERLKMVLRALQGPGAFEKRAPLFLGKVKVCTQA